MIVSFLYPSSNHRTGGVTVLYEFANGLTRRGHDVQFIHGPRTDYRVARVDEIPFSFEPGIRHAVVDAVDDPRVVDGDVVFAVGLPERLGLPCAFVQGYRMLDLDDEQRSFRAAAPKACVATWLVEVGAGLGVPRHQLWHVPPGLRHELFLPQRGQHERSHDVAVLYHPHRNKGWATALELLHVLARRRPATRSVVFGMHPPDDRLPAGTEFVLAPDHHQLVDQVYNATRVFVQTSRVEGFGYTPVEAMACGAALVTTDNGGSQDYALHEETALVTPVEDVTGLAHAVERLLDDDDLRVRLSDAGERHVRRFDWDASTERLEGHLLDYLREPDRYRTPTAVTAGTEGARW